MGGPSWNSRVSYSGEAKIGDVSPPRPVNKDVSLAIVTSDSNYILSGKSYPFQIPMNDIMLMQVLDARCNI